MSIQLGPEWRDFSNRLERAPLLYAIEIHRALEASTLLIEASAKRLAPQDTRRLSSGITQRVEGTYPNLVGVVGPNVNYGRFVEFGRPAGARMPPVDALLGWVRRHFSPRPRPGRAPARAGRARNTAWRGQEAELHSRAFALAVSIKRRADANPRGNAQPFMRPAYEQNRQRIETIFRRLGARVVGTLAGQRLP